MTTRVVMKQFWSFTEFNSALQSTVLYSVVWLAITLTLYTL